MTGVTGQQDMVTSLADVPDGMSANGHAPRLRPVGSVVTAAGLARRAGDARAAAESLAARGAGAVAITVVDNSWTR